jgi:putative N6-adenine-specific DNA methylase
MADRAYFATTSKGLEKVLAEEIAALGGRRISVGTGGVSFFGSLELSYRANLWLRTANRVLLNLSEFGAATPDALYEGARKIHWPDLFPARSSIAVDASVRESDITNSLFAAQKTKDAVVDRFRETAGTRPDVDIAAPDVRVHVRIVRDLCTVSLDTSGESLNRRGYRADPAEASLRETVAAGIVLLSGWSGDIPLADPVCGAGTILIEAALIASRTAPGFLRSSFGFQRLADYRPKLWETLLAEAGEKAIRSGFAPIEGSDISGEAVKAAVRNARKAGVSDLVSFSVRDIRDFSPDGPPGIILCNPPYGMRMAPEDERIESIYRAMGEAFKKRCRGWTAHVLSGNPAATRYMGLKASRRIPLMNGPIDCRLLRYELY